MRLQLLLVGTFLVGCGDDDEPVPMTDTSPCAATDGQCIFRHDTFGDEQLWTDVLRLHEVVQTLPPKAALAVGLKVDADAVPAEMLASADLGDPATVVALIALNAVVGVRGTVESGEITRIGITCALCHSSVDDSVAPGIGKRLDGYPNRALNPGAIIAFTPGLPTFTAKLGVPNDAALTALMSWGAGKYDARFNQDTESHPVMIPPAYGLRDVALETFTGEGPISYWNEYVAVTQMGARVERVRPMLPALRDYQFSLAAPTPPPGSFDAAAAQRGKALFEGQARCASCHSGASFTDAPKLHAAAETGMATDEARRSMTGMYRTTPLRGAWQHPPYFHDGSAATLLDVVNHYDTVLNLGLSEPQRADLEQYLLSL